MSTIDAIQNKYFTGQKWEERKDSIERLWVRFTSNSLTVIGSLMILSIVMMAAFAPWVAPYPQDSGRNTHFDQTFESPSLEHPMGTDSVGRDIFSRMLFGARLSIYMGVTVMLAGVVIGVLVGLVAGYLGGVINSILMRVTDVFLSIPAILMVLAVTTILGPSLTNALIALSFTAWTWYARIVQGEVLSVKEEDYIEANRALGATWYRTTFREVFPNVTTPVLVKASIDMGFVLLIGAGLGFLGLGAQPPTPEWGVMVAQGREHIQTAWWISTFPGLIISYTVIGFNFIGDGLRDVFDVDVQGAK